MIDMNKIIEGLKDGLIVSCQARPGNPLRGASHMAAMAKAAELGGAVGIRADGVDDITAIKELTDLPIIGIYKTEPSPVFPYITPEFKHAEILAGLGVEIIAVDATLRERTDGKTAAELIRRIKGELGVPVMADIATLEEGIRAAEAGADIVATTLSGYTTYTEFTPGPDLELVRRVHSSVDVPVIAEGRYLTPEHLVEGYRAGAHAIVVGKIITNVTFITKRFIDEVNRIRREEA